MPPDFGAIRGATGPVFSRPRGPIRGEGSVGEGDSGRGGFRPPVTRAGRTLCFVAFPRDRRRSCPADTRAAGEAGGAAGPRPTAGWVGNMVNPAGKGAARAGAEDEPTPVIHSRWPESNRGRRDSGANLRPGNEWRTRWQLALTRRHGSIENGRHYMRDVTLGEDRCRVWKGNPPPVLASLRTVGGEGRTRSWRSGRSRGLRVPGANTQHLAP
jgi:hypothetical protein